jgi:Fe-S-cluster containining protein
MKNMRERFSYTDFKCIKCGECCKAGYNVHVIKRDIDKWKEFERKELLNYLYLNPQCISIISEDQKILTSQIFKNNKNKIEELVEFIRKTHLNCGQNNLCDPLIIPKSYDIMLIGIELGLEYILKTDRTGKCSFLKMNLCSIYEYKPSACTRFPYTKDNCLRKDKLFTAICSELKKVKEM